MVGWIPTALWCSCPRMFKAKCVKKELFQYRYKKAGKENRINKLFTVKLLLDLPLI